MTFVKRDTSPVIGFDVLTMLGNQYPQAGLVGLEIEVEGNKFPKTNYPGIPTANDGDKIPPMWKYTKDGSLRGQDNAEYVLREPLPFAEIPGAVEKLWKMFTDYGSILDDSNRTSVHVHLNVQKFHLNRLTTFMAMYYILEEILTEWCGAHRVGNLFCLRAKDAPALITHVSEFIATDGRSSFNLNIHHYAGMNTHALHKYGSLEFRPLRGVLEPTPVIEWVRILQRLYELSAEFPDPRLMCEMFSSVGPITFFEMLLGDEAVTVRNGSNMSDAQIRDSLYESIRLAQDICYARDWDRLNPIEIFDDPFGRPRDQVIKKLAGKPIGSGKTTVIKNYTQVATSNPHITNNPFLVASAPDPIDYEEVYDPDYNVN